MSAGNLGNGPMVPLGLDLSGVDAGFAQLLAKYQAAKGTIESSPINPGVQAGPSTFGGSSAGAGASNAGEWRDPFIDNGLIFGANREGAPTAWRSEQQQAQWAVKSFRSAVAAENRVNNSWDAAAFAQFGEEEGNENRFQRNLDAANFSKFKLAEKEVSEYRSLFYETTAGLANAHDSGGRFRSDTEESSWAMRSFRSARSGITEQQNQLSGYRELFYKTTGVLADAHDSGGRFESDQQEMSWAMRSLRSSRANTLNESDIAHDSGGRFGSDSEESAWAMKSFRAARSSTLDESDLAPGMFAGGRQWLNRPHGYLLAGAFAAHELGNLQSRDTAGWLQQFQGEDQIAQGTMATAKDNMQGLTGSLRMLAGSLFSELDDRSTYKKALAQHMGFVSESAITEEVFGVGSANVQSRYQLELNKNITDENSFSRRLRESRAENQKTRDSLDLEGQKLWNQDTPALSPEDRIKIRAQENEYNKTYDSRAAVADDKMNRDIAAAQRDSSIDQISLWNQNQGIQAALAGNSLAARQSAIDSSFKINNQGGKTFYGNVGPGDPLYTETERSYNLAQSGATMDSSIDVITQHYQNTAFAQRRSGFQYAAVELDADAKFRVNIRGGQAFYGDVGPSDPAYAETQQAYNNSKQAGADQVAKQMTLLQGSIASLADAVGRKPLQSHIDEIEAKYNADTANLDHSTDLYKQLTSQKNVQEELAKQEDADVNDRIGLALTGRGRQLKDLLARKPIIAGLDAMQTSAEGDALGLFQAGKGDLARQSLQNSIKAMQVQKQDLLDSYKASDVDPREGWGVEDPRKSSSLNEIMDKIDAISTKFAKDIAGGIAALVGS